MSILNWIFGERKKPTPDAVFAKMERHLFRAGQKDVDQMSSATATAAPGKLSRAEAESIGRSLSAMLVISNDKSEHRLLLSLTPKDADPL